MTASPQPSPFHGRTRRPAPVLVSAAALALALAGCSGAGSAETGTAGSANGTIGTANASANASAAPVSDGAARVAVSIEQVDGEAQCVPSSTSAPAGPVTFTVSNKDAAGVSELELLNGQRILGERENIVAGLKPVTFTLTLAGGDYTLYCPGAGTESIPFTVTGAGATATATGTDALLASGTKGYAAYVTGQVDGLVEAVAALQAAVDSGNVAAAQQAYARARPFFERIEPVAESFPDLDPALDLRVADVAPGTAWTGFHPLEKDLFEARAITAHSKELAAGIVTNTAKLKKLTAGLEYQAEELANGASGLLEEVQSTKITGEEEAYSRLDLVDFAANIEGSQQAFEYLKPALESIDPALADQISAQFATVTKALNGYKDPAALGGYRPYTAELKKTDAAKLTALIQSLQQPLARIAEKVATA